MKAFMTLIVLVFVLNSESALAWKFKWPRRPKPPVITPTAPLSAWEAYIQSIMEAASKQNPPISAEALDRVVQFLKTHQKDLEGNLTNRHFITINDFTQLSTEKRMIVLDLTTGGSYRLLVSHGWGSGFGPHVYHCSNRPGSNETPPGFHIVLGENPNSRFGSSLYMKGLEERNDNSYRRAIVFHPNKTNAEKDAILKRDGYLNMSEGCAQVTREDYSLLKPLLRGGSLMYNFCPEDEQNRLTL